ncbi:MAG TPA: type II CAAX endopeptidase family protein [Thermoanaerobaculia bacterium]|nr:type II CAAX endopeptidase family protein [Thermoanaerobaculia bacterium]
MQPKGTVRRWVVLLRVVIFIVACAVVLAAVSPIAAKMPDKWPELLTGLLASLGAFALTLLFVRWERLRLDDVGTAINARSVTRLAFGFLIGLLLVALWATILAASGSMRWARASGCGFSSAAMALAAYLALACREELAFRGYPLRRLDQRFGFVFAQLFVALVFAAEHKLGGWPWSRALAGAGVGALLFGMAAIASRGLAVPIGLHAAWNFGQWALGLYGGPAFWKPVAEQGRDGRAPFAESAAYIGVFGSATLAFWLWRRRSMRTAIEN